jgi:hypothetical protein
MVIPAFKESCKRLTHASLSAFIEDAIPHFVKLFAMIGVGADELSGLGIFDLLKFEIDQAVLAHGREILATLVPTLLETCAGDCVVSDSVIAKAREFQRNGCQEQELVQLYLPMLRQVVGEIEPKLQLVDSEGIDQLRGPSKVKSGLLLAYHALIKHTSSADLLCSKFPSWHCRSSIWCLFNGKWKIDDAAFGEICNDLQNWGERCELWEGKVPSLKGILFDIDEFWMIEGWKAEIKAVKICKWNQLGSSEVLKNFLATEDPWMTCTELLLGELGIQFPDDLTPLLGAGAFGRTFRLTSGQVLKVSTSSIYEEYEYMCKIQSDPMAAKLLIPIVVDSYREGTTGDCNYGGYLLEYEGEKIRTSCPRRQKDRSLGNSCPGTVEIDMVKSLLALHQTGFLHGDPRVANVLLKNGELKWIDFQSRSLNGDRHVEDWSILFRSLTGEPKDNLWPRLTKILSPNYKSDRMRMDPWQPWLPTRDLSSPELYDDLLNYLLELWSDQMEGKEQL